MLELQIFQGPAWFTGFDLFMDLFSAIVVGIIAFFAYRFYALDKTRKNSLLLFQAMLGLSLAMIFKVIAYISLYVTRSKITSLEYLGKGVYQVQLFNSAQATFFFMHAALMIASLYLFFLIYEDNKSKLGIIFTSYLLISTLVFTENVYISFTLTTFLLFALISRRFWITYSKNKLKNTKYLAFSFAVLALSKLIFLFTNIHQLAYVIAEVVQLAGVIFLLISFVMVLRNAKKKG